MRGEKKFLNREHWYRFKRGKKITELYGNDCATYVSNRLSFIGKRPSLRKGKTDIEFYGQERAKKKAEKLSVIASKNQELGVLGTHRAKSSWVYNPFTKRKEFMHSSWESIFLQKMIALDKPVTKMHDIRINYDSYDGIMRTYTPDFFGIDTKTIYEIKGYMTEKDLHKLSALKTWANQNGYIVIVLNSLKAIHAHGG